MNKKGQAALVGMMIFFFIVITALVLIHPLKDLVDEVRAPSQLDCGNTSITFGQKSTCLIVDLTVVYFIGVVILSGAAYLVLKRVFGE